MKNPSTLLALILLIVLTFFVKAQDDRSVANQSVSKLPSKEKRWALIIGINEYEKDVSTLRGAVNDAQALKNVLVQYAGFPESQIILLTSNAGNEDNRPKRENILGALNDLSSRIPEDGLFLFSFSGHGVSVGKQAFLVPSNGRITKNLTLLKSLSINVSDIKEAIQETKVRQVLMFLDACRNEPGKGETPNLMTEAYKNGFSFDIANSEVKAFATLYATSVGERAFEFYDKETKQQRGYFSYAVEEALKGKAANEKGEVTLGRLIDYVERFVPGKVRFEKGEVQFPSTTISETYKADSLILSVAFRDRNIPLVESNITADNLSDVDRQFAESYFKSAIEKRRNGELQEALTEFRKAIEVNPKYYDAYIERGATYQSYQRVINYDKALIDFNMAVALKPKEARGYNFRGNIYRIKGLLEAAINEYSRAIALNPTNGVYFNNRAVTYLANKDYDLAIADCKTSIKLDLKYAYQTLGDVYFAVKNYNSAVESYTVLINMGPYADGYRKRAAVYNALGKHNLAEVDLRKAKDLEKQYETGLCTLKVSNSPVFIIKDGGWISVTIDGNKEMAIDAISSSPTDIEVSLQPPILKLRKLFIIRSISNKPGKYQVIFKSDCGKQTSVEVRVR